MAIKFIKSQAMTREEDVRVPSSQLLGDQKIMTIRCATRTEEINLLEQSAKARGVLVFVWANDEH